MFERCGMIRNRAPEVFLSTIRRCTITFASSFTRHGYAGNKLFLDCLRLCACIDTDPFGMLSGRRDALIPNSDG